MHGDHQNGKNKYNFPVADACGLSGDQSKRKSKGIEPEHAENDEIVGEDSCEAVHLKGSYLSEKQGSEGCKKSHCETLAEPRDEENSVVRNDAEQRKGNCDEIEQEENLSL